MKAAVVCQFCLSMILAPFVSNGSSADMFRRSPQDAPSASRNELLNVAAWNAEYVMGLMLRERADLGTSPKAFDDDQEPLPEKCNDKPSAPAVVERRTDAVGSFLEKRKVHDDMWASIVETYGLRTLTDVKNGEQVREYATKDNVQFQTDDAGLGQHSPQLADALPVYLVKTKKGVLRIKAGQLEMFAERIKTNDVIFRHVERR